MLDNECLSNEHLSTPQRAAPPTVRGQTGTSCSKGSVKLYNSGRYPANYASSEMCRLIHTRVPIALKFLRYVIHNRLLTSERNFWYSAEYGSNIETLLDDRLITDPVVDCSISPVDMFSLSEVVEQLLEMHQRPLGHHIPEYPSPEPSTTVTEM